MGILNAIKQFSPFTHRNRDECDHDWYCVKTMSTTDILRVSKQEIHGDSILPFFGYDPYKDYFSDRVCLKCNKVDNRLSVEIEKTIAIQRLGQQRKAKANQIYAEYKERSNRHKQGETDETVDAAN